MENNVCTVITEETLQEAFKFLLDAPVRKPMTQAEYDMWTEIYRNPPKFF